MAQPKPRTHVIKVTSMLSETMKGDATILGFYLNDTFITTRVCSNEKVAETLSLTIVREVYGRLLEKGLINRGDALESVHCPRGETTDHDKPREHTPHPRAGQRIVKLIGARSSIGEGDVDFESEPVSGRNDENGANPAET